ncbi:MAG: DUF4405 domain-containing protein [Gammaproteobacteria bacterium]|nr:DUF4405 domain-containing protein [Gammaproteobacteria bacterium]
MNQFTLTKVLDLFSFVALMSMLSTGVFLKITLPPRSGGDQVWGLSRHEWGDIHFYLSVIFLLLMSAHLLVHAKFIKSVIIGKAPTGKYYRIVAGIIGVIALIALTFSPVISPVTDVQRGQQHFHNR